MQLQLQIADQFDTLANGKVLAVGLFADRVVVMQVPAEAPEPSAQLPYAMELGLLLNLSGAALPQAHGEVRILPPGSGQPVGVLAFDGLNLTGGHSANILTTLKPLLVPQAGVYTVEVRVGNDTVRGSFEVRIQRLAPSTPPVPPIGVTTPAPAQSKRRRLKP